jgi:hypothetical protein
MTTPLSPFVTIAFMHDIPPLFLFFLLDPDEAKKIRSSPFFPQPSPPPADFGIGVSVGVLTSLRSARKTKYSLQKLQGRARWKIASASGIWILWM